MRASGWSGAATGRTSIIDGRPMDNDGDLLDLMLDWVADERARNRILVDNARALYGFPKP